MVLIWILLSPSMQLSHLYISILSTYKYFIDYTFGVKDKEGRHNIAELTPWQQETFFLQVPSNQM